MRHSPTRVRRPAPLRNTYPPSWSHPSIGLYKIFFYLFLWVQESIIPLLPPPICITHTTAILLHDECATYDPLRPPVCMQYTIQCVGQVTPTLDLLRWTTTFPPTSSPRACKRRAPRSLGSQRVARGGSKRARCAICVTGSGEKTAPTPPSGCLRIGRRRTRACSSRIENMLHAARWSQIYVVDAM